MITRSRLPINDHTVLNLDDDGLKDEPMKVLVSSPIPVVKSGTAYFTLDLWARDVNAQAQVAAVTVLCNVESAIEGAMMPLDPRIDVIPAASGAVSGDVLAGAVARADVIQITGQAGWRAAAESRRILRVAKRSATPVFLGISSNRARTNVINAQKQSFAHRLRARIRAFDITATQRWLARRSAGVFVVGEGLRKLIEPVARTIHVGVASWVEESDIAPPRQRGVDLARVCMAGRLEPMKGFHIGIEAFALAGPQHFAGLTIIGEGAERERLTSLAGHAGIDAFKMLHGVSYPDGFFAFLDRQDIVLMTNLNDEQPRLIFDAISRGCIPLCPATPPYRSLGLDPRVLYEQGSAESLAARLRELADPDVRMALSQSIAALARTYTVTAMHRARLQWMKEARSTA
ncbi:glycosyltransferase [Sphingomonas sp. PAMC 26621]|uniref:glycosyltransferase n=1 Tax=Sphingomonas sp. PAMC 26621 TaxID=1112213 RepID=UPI001EE6918B|nr:glycosyltransferase [Sphingomonas sp. PAMC 26621]